MRKHPSIHDVTVMEPGFCTPRMVMHRCLYGGKYDDRYHEAGYARRFHYDGDAARLNCFLNGNRNLFGETLLHLQASGKGLSDAR